MSYFINPESTYKNNRYEKPSSPHTVPNTPHTVLNTPQGETQPGQAGHLVNEQQDKIVNLTVKTARVQAYSCEAVSVCDGILERLH
jgi:hypothetical protein